MAVTLSIVIAIAGFLTACAFTYKAYRLAKKSAEEQIYRRKIGSNLDN